MADNDVDFDSDHESEMETQSDGQSAEEIERLLTEADISDIPDTLIVTNVPDSVWDDDNSKVLILFIVFLYKYILVGGVDL